MMDDKELDTLIIESIGRSEMLAEMTRGVMREVRTSERRRRWRVLGRMAAFAFGLPLLGLAFALGLYFMYAQGFLGSPLTMAAAVAAAGCLAVAANRAIGDFSAVEV